MKHEIPIRIQVLRPLAGVTMQVQRGRGLQFELLPPSPSSDGALIFDLSVEVDLSSGTPNFLGEFTQGPKDARFIYVNTGTLAGQPAACWTRRAKLSLMSITQDQIETVFATSGMILQAEFEGVGRDGGPTCASVKGIEWKVAAK